MMKNRRGIAPIAVVGIILLVILFLYLMLFIPLPAFKVARNTINYFLLIGLFILVQVGLIYLYYHIFKFSNDILKRYKKQLRLSLTKVKEFLVVK